LTVSRDVIRYAIHYSRWSYSFWFGTNSVVISQSFSMDQASLAYHHFSGVFAGILHVGRMLGERIVSDHGVRLLALLRVCLCIHL
jgi:hypothetical protein